MNHLATLVSAASAGAAAAVATAVRGVVGVAPPATPPAAATTCIRLDGLITEEMLRDVDYPEVVRDIRQECERWGAVLALKIPREGAAECGATFVRYETLAEAARARASLDRRVFAGNIVRAQFVPHGSF